MNKLFVETLLYFSFFARLHGFSSSPPYQVSLYVNSYNDRRPHRICDGVIVQSRLILTTATCVHHSVTFNGTATPRLASEISLAAGNGNIFNEALKFAVSEIKISDKFNLSTLENDVAILRLHKSLPLSSREDIKWIILDEIQPNDDYCLINFYVKNPERPNSAYIQTEELQILESNECAQYSKHPGARKNDMCFQYTLPQEFNCNSFENYLLLNNDRGTGIVCNSRLVALFSSIPPYQNINNNTECAEMLVKAISTNLGPHLDWIYEIIAFEEYIDIMQKNYTSSAPYQQLTGAIMQSSNTEIASAHGIDISSATTITNIKDDSTPHVQQSNTSAQNTVHRIYFFAMMPILSLLLLHVLL